MLILLLGAPMDSQYRAPCLFKPFTQLQTPFPVLKNPNFADNRNCQIFMQMLYQFPKNKLLSNLHRKVLILKKKGPIVPLLRNLLRTPKIDIDSNTLLLYHLAAF